MKLGTEVSWTSQSAGYVKEKRGEIVAVIQKNKQPNLDALLCRHKAKERLGTGGPRDHKSYVVLVSNDPTRKPSLYWPRVSQLEVV